MTKTPETASTSAALADAAREVEIARTGALYADAAHQWAASDGTAEACDEAFAKYNHKVAQHKLAAFAYARAVLDQAFGRVLDDGELHRTAMPLIDDLLRVAHERPESLP